MPLCYSTKIIPPPCTQGLCLDLWSSLLSFDRVDASITLFSLNRSLGMHRLRCVGDTCCKSKTNISKNQEECRVFCIFQKKLILERNSKKEKLALYLVNSNLQMSVSRRYCFIGLPCFYGSSVIIVTSQAVGLDAAPVAFETGTQIGAHTLRVGTVTHGIG